ncbi:hypothetical protein Syun_014779 [Stephania yunnanensis]|uniref:Uncharacterized protein n=1 Tax=Stephania yunnanensis TaxID=152371 RepID=A0AAP0JKB0_9MAGN
MLQMLSSCPMRSKCLMTSLFYEKSRSCVHSSSIQGNKGTSGVPIPKYIRLVTSCGATIRAMMS